MKILHPNTPLFYFVLLTMLLLSSMVTAQPDLLPENRTSCYGGFGYLSFSGEQLNLSDLNTVLSENAYGTLNVYSSSLGGGGSFAAHNFLIGGGGAWLMNTNTQNQVNTCELKGGYGYFSFGYVLHAGKRTLLYSCIGLGGDSYDILISKKNTGGDFSRQLNTPEGMVLLKSGGWMTNGGTITKH